MKLRDLLDQDHLLLVACDDCQAKTPLDPAPIALLHGVGLSVAVLTHDMRCPTCGSADIRLSAFSPVEQREVAIPMRHDGGVEAAGS